MMMRSSRGGRFRFGLGDRGSGNGAVSVRSPFFVPPAMPADSSGAARKATTLATRARSGLGARRSSSFSPLLPRAVGRFTEVDREESTSLAAIEAGVDRTEVPDDQVTWLALEGPGRDLVVLDSVNVLHSGVILEIRPHRPGKRRPVVVGSRNHADRPVLSVERIEIEGQLDVKLIHWRGVDVGMPRALAIEEIPVTLGVLVVRAH